MISLEPKQYRLVFRKNDIDSFIELAKGVKTIETRAASPRFINVKSGDTLKISCGANAVVKRVVSVHHYKSVEAMLSDLPIKEIFPSAKDIEEVLEIYRGYGGYQDKIAKFGILAFRID